MVEERQQMRLNALPEVKPFFASDVNVGVSLQQSKDKKEKGGTLNINFVDMGTKTVVSSVNITLITAKSLVELLNKTIGQIEKFIKTGEIPKILTNATEEPSSHTGVG